MSVVTGANWADAARAERDEVDRGIAYNESLLAQDAARRDELVARGTRAFDELTAALLPRLDAASLHHAANLTGYSPLVSENPLDAMRAEEARLRQRLADLGADPRYVHREHLRDPRGGKLVRELAEVEQAMATFRPLLDACNHPRFEHLLTVGYGTEAYAVPFWRLSYYSDWEAGDEILERLPALRTFAEVRDHHARARDAWGALEASATGLRAQLSEGERIEREYGEAYQALATLGDRTLAELRRRLGRHVLECGAALGPRLAGAPAVEMLAKRVLGLSSQLLYLDRAREAHLLKAKNELEAARARAEREIAKFSRPKKMYATFDRADFDRRFRPRYARYQKGWQRYQQASDAIYVFDRYDRGSWVQDFLWWDLISDGSIDGDFIPEVAEHHRHFPGRAHAPSAWHADDPNLPPELHDRDDGPLDPS